jgi:hypothetical protein
MDSGVFAQAHRTKLSFIPNPPARESFEVCPVLVFAHSVQKPHRTIPLANNPLPVYQCMALPSNP